MQEENFAGIYLVIGQIFMLRGKKFLWIVITYKFLLFSKIELGNLCTIHRNMANKSNVVLKTRY